MIMITNKASIANRIPIQLRPLLAPGEGTAAEGRGPDPVPWNGITQLDDEVRFSQALLLYGAHLKLRGSIANFEKRLIVKSLIFH